MPLVYQELLRTRIAEATLSSIQGDTCTLTDVSILKLGALFPNTLLIAALDLADRDRVIKYTTQWGRSYYEVLGSTSTYAVFPTPAPTSAMSIYCTCPAFVYAVLKNESHVLCKHILATRIAQQLSRCIERPIDQDGLATIIARQFS